MTWKPARLGAESWHLWVRVFTALVVPFAALKAAVVLYYATGGRSFEPTWKLASKSLMYFGSDILGAALLALVVLAVVALPLALGRPRIAHLLAGVLAGLLAGFEGASVISQVYMGGPLTLQALQAVAISEDSAGVSQAAMVSSMMDMLNPVSVAALLLPPVLALWAFHVPGPGLARWQGGRRWVLWGLLGAEAILTVVFVPLMVAGEIGIRIYSDGLEDSPSIIFLRSLALPVTEAFGDKVPLTDPFVLDVKAAHEVRPAGDLPPLAGAKPARTNVVFVMLESVGEVYQEDPLPFMPFLKALGSEGGHGTGAAWFKRHYSTFSLTTAAWFSMLCSELPYPSFKPVTRLNPSIPCRCLSETLADEGYRTILASSHPATWDQRTGFLKYRAFETSFDSLGNPRRPKAFTNKWGIDDAATVDEALSLLAKDDGRPFFLFLMLISGHHPFIASREQALHPAEDRLTEYKRALAHGDKQLARFYEGLKALGVDDTTLIVVVSDHGEAHGPQAGRNVLEPVVRVPLVMRGPQLEGLVVDSDLVTSHTDIPPTILGLLGIPVPCTMKGRNLLSDGGPRVAFFGGRPPKAQLGLLDGPWKFVLEDRRDAFLFNVIDDPEQRTNLAGQQPALAAQLEQRLRYVIAHAENLIPNYSAILRASGCNPRAPRSPQGH